MDEDGEEGRRRRFMAFQRGLMCIIFCFCFPHPPFLLCFLYSWRGILFTFFIFKCHDMGIFYTGWWKSAAGYYIAGSVG